MTHASETFLLDTQTQYDPHGETELRPETPRKSSFVRMSDSSPLAHDLESQFQYDEDVSQTDRRGLVTQLAQNTSQDDVARKSKGLGTSQELPPTSVVRSTPPAELRGFRLSGQSEALSQGSRSTSSPSPRDIIFATQTTPIPPSVEVSRYVGLNLLPRIIFFKWRKAAFPINEEYSPSQHVYTGLPAPPALESASSHHQ
jgi:hypothetical protein